MLEIGEVIAKNVSKEEAVMIGFFTPGWRLPTREEYLKYGTDELKYCWDQEDIHDEVVANVLTGNVKLVRIIDDS